MSVRTGKISIPKTSYPRIFVLVGGFFFVSVAAILYAEIMATAISFDCQHTNGCFQMYNPLRRLAAGQIPGYDFQFFYGVGTALLHYPLFWLAGSDLLSSEISKIMLSPLLFIAVTVSFSRAVLRSWRRSFFAAAVIGSLSSLLFPAIFFDDHHLFGVRAAVPVAAGCLLLYLLRRRIVRSWLLSALMAVLSAASFFVSPDQGVSMIIGSVIAITVFSGAKLSTVKSLGFFVAVCLLTILALFGITSGVWLFEPLRYHLFVSRLDHFWLFGAVPGGFFGSENFFSGRAYIPISYGLSVVVLIALVKYKKSIERSALVTASYLLAYGVFSTAAVLGYERVEYFHALYWCMALVALLLLHQLKIVHKKIARHKAFAVAILALLAFGAMTHRTVIAWSELWEAKGRSVGVQALGVTMSPRWTEHIIAADTMIDEGDGRMPIWSTFSGPTEASLDIFNPASDYMFHSQGPEARQRYYSSFSETQPQLVRTTDNEKYFEYWLSSTYWPFYEMLLDNYSVMFKNYGGALWVRNDRPWRERADDEWEGRLEIEDNAIILPANKAGAAIMAIRIEYEIRNPWRSFPVIGGLPRYHLHASAKEYIHPYYYSLPSYAEQFIFPVYLRENQPVVRYAARAQYFLPFVDVALKSAQYRYIETSPENINFFQY